MRKLLNAILIALIPLAVGCQSNPKLDGYASFGAPETPARVISLAKAVDRMDELGGPVWVQAQIKEVCQNRGCWMSLDDGAHNVRVRFTASAKCTDGFLLPRNAGGHYAYVHGVLKRQQMPQELARHYAEDQGKSKEEVETIVGSQAVVTMLATSVVISQGATLDEPLR